MDGSLLEPRRLEVLHKVMSLYGAHLQVGDRVRVGIEGDPLSPFRSAEDAPAVTVTSIEERHDDGLLRFRGRVEGSGSEIELTNRSFDPKGVWEVHPESLDAFAERVASYRGAAAPVEAAAEPDGRIADRLDGLAQQVDALGERVSRMAADLSERVANVEETSARYQGVDAAAGDRAFRETMASTVRALAGDVMRLARNEPIEFAHNYADRYDDRVETRAMEPADDVDGAYRGGEGGARTERRRRNGGADDWRNAVIRSDEVSDN